MQEEKRKFNRYRVPLKDLTFKMVEDNDTIVINIGECGMLVSCPVNYKINTELKIDFKLPGENGGIPLKCKGLVRWGEAAGNYFLIGIFFTDIKEKQREQILNYTADLDQID